MNFLYGFTVILLSFPGYNAVAQTSRDEIMVLPVNIQVPAGAKELGALKIGNNTTKTHCDYEEIVAVAKDKAKAMGGNIVKITKLIPPAFIGKCYKVQADVYYVKELPDYHIQDANDTKLPAAFSNSYATLYIYRLPDTLALITPYKLHLNDDSVICTEKSKSRDSVKIFKEGTVTLWAKTEKREALNLDVKFGQAYYIRCGLVKGEIRMNPVLQLVDSSTGATEYGKLGKRKKNTGVSYLKQIH